MTTLARLYLDSSKNYFVTRQHSKVNPLLRCTKANRYYVYYVMYSGRRVLVC